LCTTAEEEAACAPDVSKTSSAEYGAPVTNALANGLAEERPGACENATQTSMTEQPNNFSTATSCR